MSSILSRCEEVDVQMPGLPSSLPSLRRKFTLNDQMGMNVFLSLALPRSGEASEATVGAAAPLVPHNSCSQYSPPPLPLQKRKLTFPEVLPANQPHSSAKQKIPNGG